jgi:hypothetical protein
LPIKIPRKKKDVFGTNRKRRENFGRFFALKNLLKNLLLRNPVFSSNAYLHTKRKSQGKAIIFSTPISEYSNDVPKGKEGVRTSVLLSQ